MYIFIKALITDLFVTFKVQVCSHQFKCNMLNYVRSLLTCDNIFQKRNLAAVSKVMNETSAGAFNVNKCLFKHLQFTDNQAALSDEADEIKSTRTATKLR